jgi:hypothetical protein
MKPTYIRITQCSVPTYWYSSKIGKVYKVKGKDNGDYAVKKGYILISDCTPVTLGKVRVKKYKGQELYGISAMIYTKDYEGKEFIIKTMERDGVNKGVFYEFGGHEDEFKFHESLVKPV